MSSMDEGQLISQAANEYEWGYSSDIEDEARTAIMKIKADAWDEAIDEARARLMMMGTDEDELKEANPYR